MSGRLGITDVQPTVDAGTYPARAVVGEAIPISALVFREGHDKVGANVVFSAPAPPRGARPRGRAPFLRMRLDQPGTDLWLTTAVADRPGRWSFMIEAWSDPLGTWWHAIEAKVDAGQGPEDLANDIADGVHLLQRAAAKLPPEPRDLVLGAARALDDEDADLAHRLAPALDPALRDLLYDYPVRDLVTRSRRHYVWVDRKRAMYGSWYEFFPRSTGGWDDEGKPVHGTFATAAEALPRIATMGFDVVYLPPIHPIGHVNRKGPNNTLLAGPDDVGSPWAIGSSEGGHDAFHPDLGSEDDFVEFLQAAKALDLEVALDFALQCAPDHPWVLKHPEWFTTKPDGTIAYAENPPKKYQDIYPLNFDNDPQGIYAEILRVLEYWVRLGVRVFRVDNPHTKPLNFWHWVIWQVKKSHPDVLFLSEAFTRPAMLRGLAKLGFTQSYTYFTWRTEKWEIEQFGRDLVETSHYLRPNLFVNTPDILHASLQYGGPAMFKIRAALASTMSPTWGVYSGFELFEHVAVRTGSEEYLDSEKYQLRPRDFAAARAEGRSLEGYLTRLNHIRRAHPALQANVRELHFHRIDNDRLTVYSRRDPLTGDTVLVVCALDSQQTQIGTTDLDLPALGLDWPERFVARDELTGATYDWGQFNYVELDPAREPAHILSVRPHSATT